MELKSLFLHSATLLKIILKTYKPADAIAREYFAQNKYIGSSDRRFISESVFNCLRNFHLSKNGAETLLKSPDTRNQVVNNRAQDVKNEFFFIYFSSLIANHFSPLKHYFNPDEILGNFYKQENYSFNENASAVIAEILDLPKENSDKLVSDAIRFFDELDEEANKIRNQKTISGKALQIIETRFSINSWILKSWLSSRLTPAAVCDLAESLCFPAPAVLRAAISLISVERGIQELKAEGIDAEPGKLSPSAIRLKKRQNINNLKLYKRGLLEVQDEGSQIISYAAAPAEDDRILDACAGAGGKTLHLAAIQSDRGEIMATDIEFNRLKEIRLRAARFGFKSITTHHVRAEKIPKELLNWYDLVLVDAPCSGLGTTRRLPLPKVRLTPELASKLARNQLKILETYSACVRSGGVLVYSTCSLLPTENQDVIAKFLELHPEFEPEPISNGLESFGIEVENLGPDDHYVTLFPSVHETDGFFIARMRKTAR